MTTASFPSAETDRPSAQRLPPLGLSIGGAPSVEPAAERQASQPSSEAQPKFRNPGKSQPRPDAAIFERARSSRNLGFNAAKTSKSEPMEAPQPAAATALPNCVGGPSTLNSNIRWATKNLKINMTQAAGGLRAQAQRMVQSPQWARMGQTGLYATVAVAISVTVGILCAATVTPWFLTLSLPATNAASMLAQLPFVGSILTGIILRGGPFGALCSSLVLWFGTKAQFSSGPVHERRWNWAVAAVAVGFALSPIFVPAVPVTGALAAGCLLGTAALGYLSSRALQPQGKPDWRVNLMAIAIGISFAPMGAQAGLLLPHAAVLGEALIITTLFAVGITVHAVYNLVSPLFRANVEAAKSNADIKPSELVLDRKGPDHKRKVGATVFGSQDMPELCDFIDLAKQDIDNGVIRRVKFLVLRGPAGSGKFTLAQAVAASLGIPVETPTLESLRAAGNSASALDDFFNKAKERAQITQKPVAILIKDINRLLAVRDRGNADNDMMVNASLPHLWHQKGAPKSNLLVIGTIEGDALLDGGLKSRCDEYKVPRASAATLSALLDHLLRTELDACHLVPPTLQTPMPSLSLPEAFLATVGAAAYACGLTGRDITAYADLLCEQVRLEVGRAGGTCDAEALITRVQGAHAQKFADFAQQHAPQDAPSEASSAASSPSVATPAKPMPQSSQASQVDANQTPSQKAPSETQSCVREEPAAPEPNGVDGGPTAASATVTQIDGAQPSEPKLPSSAQELNTP